MGDYFKAVGLWLIVFISVAFVVICTVFIFALAATPYALIGALTYWVLKLAGAF